MTSKVTKDDSLINKVLSIIFSKTVRMSVEFSMFTKYQLFSEGVDFLNIKFETRYQGDHTPFINLFIGIFNFKILELAVYNVLVDEEEEEVIEAPYKMEPQQEQRSCTQCVNYGLNTRTSMTHQCVLNGSGLGSNPIVPDDCDEFAMYIV